MAYPVTLLSARKIIARKCVGLLILAAVLGIVSVSFGASVVYKGSAKGFGSQVNVEVTITDGKVTGLTVDDSGESYTAANITRETSVEKVIRAILERGSTDGVDATSGATFTSQAVISVVNEALAVGKQDTSSVNIEFKPGTYTGHGKGRAGVDAVSGATMTSNEFLAAVTDALTQASSKEVIAH